MAKIKIVICDTQTAYCERMTTYFMNRRKGEFEVRTYTDPEKFWEEIGTLTSHAVLMSEAFWKDEVFEGSVMRFIFLYEERIPEKWNSFPAIYKYQSVENIIREILGLIEEKGEAGRICVGSKQLIGIYSPHQHELQSVFALTVAKLLSEKEKVLYLNFMDCAGFGSFSGEDYEQDIGDLLFMARGSLTSFGTKLKAMVHKLGDIDYIPPALNPENLHEASAEDYKNLLQLIDKSTDYSVILMDFGMMLPGFYELIRECNTLYCPIKEGFLYQSRIKQFRDCLALAQEEHLDEHICYFPFSMDLGNIQTEEQLRQQIFWGEIGDRIRQQLFGGTAVSAYG